MRDYADLAHDIIWIMDEDGVCIHLNAAWSSFTKQPSQSALGHGWLLQVHPDDRSGLMETYLAAARFKAPYTGRHRLHHASGGYVSMIGCGHPYFGAAGEFMGYFGTSIPVEATKHFSGFADLTSREREVLGFLVDGATSKEIGRVLSISDRTVDVHRARMCQKVGARNTVELVRIVTGAKLLN